MGVGDLPGLDESRRILTPGELAFIRDERDIPILAHIKSMSDGGLEYFQRFWPRSDFVKEYITAQVEWARVGAWFLGSRLGRSPSNDEWWTDYQENKNTLRFRAFYAMKFPDRVENVLAETRQEERTSA